MGSRLVERLKPIFQWLATTDAFMKAGPKIVPRLDRAVHRLTGGRRVMSDRMIPTLLLTTTGSKSGEPRVSPLACLPEAGGSFLVVGSNFGREHHPAWSGNLLKTPQAEVSFRGRVVPVTGRLLDGEERDRAWEQLLRIWPVYDRYTEKSGRELRVFRLSPIR
ncbi:nitroreductase family deazaflavin-dependent oxidoreductase [Planomonospora sp. ID67723]|uniref:nitroreductase family deazaflavin-dependent oxidoreductase n=1 Tax=Planomonospora sp. ID67723 TaxID=2738134 RepID=UPI0018C3E30F|nr:nitroreductase family deazaflavin-dependent oxidoreductase [Planomonospora sp. ID67723]MBG0829995.1 nitroreductase family deazaflavin-dependent oxidoreductase [Planomonospora sp. ID67723]